MDKKVFFNEIKDNYFISQSCNLEDFKTMVCSVLPIFGELKTTIAIDENEKIITFIDVDEADISFAPEDLVLTKEDLDMTAIVFRLVINSKGVIIMVEHNMDIFTCINKEFVLFLSSIIGNKILL